MSLRKILCMTLAALTLGSAVCACGAASSAAPADTTASTAAAASSEETTSGETTYVDANLPSENYDGYAFRIVSVDDGTVPDSENGEVVNDAKYKRNFEIEEKYGVKFSQKIVQDYGTMSSNFKTAVLANSDDFDLNRLIMRDAFSFALQGYIADTSQLPYIDITQPWYVKYVNDELTIGGKLYFAYSDECTDTLTGMFCVIFNKALIENLGLDSPYDLVDKGTWTIDKFFSSAKAAIADLNGDGKYTIEDDRWGIVDEYDMLVPSMWEGAGMKTVEKDSDGIPFFNTDDLDRMYSLLQTVFDNWNSDGMCYDSFLSKGFDEANRIYARNYYKQEHGLYMVQGFGIAGSLRDMEDDFGLVPLPKYDESQERYYTRLCDGWILVPPYCAPDLTRTSVIMEALAVGSKNYVIPAIYNDALVNKYIRDDESLRMLDIIQANRIIDLGDTIWMDPIRNAFVDSFFNRKANFASDVEKKTKKIQSTIAKAMEAVTDSSNG